MIEMGKQYKTRDGRGVRILCVDASSKQPVIGLLGEEVHRWSSNGSYYMVDGESISDLIEQVPVVETYMPIFQNSGMEPELSVAMFQHYSPYKQGELPRLLRANLRIRQPAGNADPGKIEVAVIPLEGE